MRIVRNPESTPPCVLVLGMFDGVHRGHQSLLMRGAELAEEYGVPLNVGTFEPHPLAVLRPGSAPARLTTQTERAQLMAGFGVDQLCVMTFTRELADQEPEEFMAQMVRVFSPRVVVCGFNFTFGRAGLGNGKTLTEYGRTHGFAVSIVPEVVLDGATVSSTRVRRLLETGNMPKAASLMGHAYTVTARVQPADRGAAVYAAALPRGKAMPAPGAYACFLTVDGQHYPSIVELEAERTMIVRSLDCCLRLNGRQLRMTFMRRLESGRADEARRFFFSL